VHLAARLKAGGFRVLDTQFITEHLKTFGAVEVSRRHYHKLLEEAVAAHADFAALPLQISLSGRDALARIGAR
jgi:leucyl/phenylalanyl-tRNA--protein transferase